MSAPRPTQDQVPPPSHAATAATAAGGVTRGGRDLHPLPRAAKFGPRRGGLGVYIWPDSGPRACTAPTPRLLRTQCRGRGPEEGAGRPGPQAWGRRSGVKGTGMPGAGEGQESADRALEKLGESLGEEHSTDPG